jgi:DNA-binding NarL/FixJ family response regulator
MAIADGTVMSIADLDTALDLLGWRAVSPQREWVALSPRERQILGLVAGGRTQKETAFELGVADATVRVLYSRAMKKLGRTKQQPPAKQPRSKAAVG